MSEALPFQKWGFIRICNPYIHALRLGGRGIRLGDPGCGHGGEDVLKEEGDDDELTYMYFNGS